MPFNYELSTFIKHFHWIESLVWCAIEIARNGWLVSQEVNLCKTSLDDDTSWISFSQEFDQHHKTKPLLTSLLLSSAALVTRTEKLNTNVVKTKTLFLKLVPISLIWMNTVYFFVSLLWIHTLSRCFQYFRSQQLFWLYLAHRNLNTKAIWYHCRFLH